MLGRFSSVWLFVTLWTIIHHAPLSMGFSRHKYWSGLPCPPPGDLPDPGIKPTCLMSPALGGFFTTNATGKAHVIPYHNISCILHSSLSPIGCKLPENSVYFWYSIPLQTCPQIWKWVLLLSRFSRVWPFETLCTVTCQIPLSMGFSRQKDCSGKPFPSPGDHPDQGIEPMSFALQADSLTSIWVIREAPSTGEGCHALLQGNFPT